MEQLGDKSANYGGSIREAGGSIGSMAAAKENEYFRRIEEQKLEELKKATSTANESNKSKDNSNSKNSTQ